MYNSPLHHSSELNTPDAFLDNIQPAKKLNEKIRLYFAAHFLFIFTLYVCNDIVSMSERTMFEWSVSCYRSVLVNRIPLKSKDVLHFSAKHSHSKM